MDKKMTYVEALEVAISAVDNAEALTKLEALKAQLVKKSAKKSPKEQAKAEQDKALMDALVVVLRAVGKATATEISKGDSILGGLSTQKIAAIAKKLSEQGIVTSFKEKKSSYYTLVGGASADEVAEVA
jgi:predicted type IV restriction endonuclease